MYFKNSVEVERLFGLLVKARIVNPFDIVDIFLVIRSRKRFSKGGNKSLDLEKILKRSILFTV